MHLYFFLCAVIQGFTEFLPISSSAHILLTAQIVGNFVVGKNFMVILHFGSMIALILFFRHTLGRMFLGLWKKEYKRYFHLALQLVVALVPTMVFGALIEFCKPAFLKQNTTLMLAINSIIFGALLYVVDKYAPNKKPLSEITYANAFFIGLAQSVAFIEGASRSGMTITAARFLGFTRVDSTKFSFLLDIPTIFAASALKLNFSYTDIYDEFELYLFGVLVVLTISLLTISVVLKLLERISFFPFALYRIILGVVLLYLYSTGQIS